MNSMRRALAFGVVLGALALGIAAVLLYQSGRLSLPRLPGCAFHKLTGLNCPGCGMTRAVRATFHGRIGEAFLLNPIGMVLLPLAFLALGIEIIGWVRGKPVPLRLQLGSRGAWGIVWVVTIFWILRNVPCWPFTLLSPP